MKRFNHPDAQSDRARLIHSGRFALTAARKNLILINAVILGLILSAGVARGQTYQVLHHFTGNDGHGFNGDTDGANPSAPLIQGPDGNFYGTTTGGSASNTGPTGTVFKMDPSGNVTILRHFLMVASGDGFNPQAGLIRGTDGNYYGTTYGSLGNTGGSGGTVFKISAAGAFTKVHTFAGSEGAYPQGGVIQGADGNFYGTTRFGGSGNRGAVFKMTPAGVTTALHSFTGGPDGAQPLTGLIQASDGNFYGTTRAGTNHFGTIFRITPAGVFTVMHTFRGTAALDGATPLGELIQAKDGNLYGTTSDGGLYGRGSVFKMDLSGKFTLLYSFKAGAADGDTPQAPLVQATDGNFYGTTYAGGQYNYGTIFRVTPSGTFTLLYSFSAQPAFQPTSTGIRPSAALIQAADGAFYGTTLQGGSQNKGVVFRLDLGLNQTEYVLPQVAEGNFGPGSFGMTFVLVNNNAGPATVTLTLTADNGTPLQVTIPGLGTQSEFVLTIEAGGMRLLQTAGTGPLRTGAARVISTQVIGVLAIFSVYDAGGRFLTEAGVGNSPPGTEFVIPVDTTGDFNTGAAFFNSGSAAANLTIRLLDAAGQEMQRTADMLLPGEHKASFVAGPGQMFPTATNFRGTLVVTTSTPVTAVVLRQNGVPLSYTSLPAVLRTAGKTQISLSQVANGSFSGGSFRTTFPIFNTSSTTANVTLTLTRDDGTPFAVTMVGRGTASTFNLVLAPGGSVVLETDGTGELAGGVAVITSSVPIGASAIFSVFDPQGRFLTEAGVGDSVALREFTLPVDIRASTDTGIAFYNPGNTAITLTILLLDASGATVATTQLTLRPRGHVAQFATQFFPGQTSFRGSIAVTATGDGVSAITLRQNASPLTYTTLPVTSGVPPD